MAQGNDNERRDRLGDKSVELSREQRIAEALDAFKRDFPLGEFGRTITKEEKEEILGYGPDGV